MNSKSFDTFLGGGSSEAVAVSSIEGLMSSDSDQELSQGCVLTQLIRLLCIKQCSILVLKQQQF